MANEIISWDNKYYTGIELIDNQHRNLVRLTNELYAACLAKDDKLQTSFKDAMKRMVEYVRYHFEAENKFLTAIDYPDCQNHRKMHDNLIKKILDTVNDYNEGKKFVPNKFVRTLVDWVFGHIAFYDKQYSLYAMDKIRVGTLTMEKLKEIENSIT
ncbi:MAG: bacteriohemerythrin [Treponema sp.]|nr:bacteriohemerythrin [Treponema sp.]